MLSTSKSPPPSLPLPLPGIPVHTRSTTTDSFNPKYQDMETTFGQLSTEMSSYFVGPVPPQVFLDSFLPLTSSRPSVPTFTKRMFSALTDVASEAEMYQKFVDIVAPHLQNLVLVNTSRMKDKAPHSKFSFSCQPDFSVYSSESDHKFGLNSTLIEFPLEFKTTLDQDPFVVKPKSPSDQESAIENPFMSATDRGRQVAGQITAYATLILSAQYRTHAFHVLIIESSARLIRWDRGGALVTAPISYDQESHLFDFLIRYDRATRPVRGHDLTVRLPTEEEERDARTLADLADTESLLTIDIPDPDLPQKTNRYVISAPYACPDIPVGRWTRTSIAYDVQRKKRVFMKDSWRVLRDDITPEGEVYAKLHQHAVPNIPHCSHAADVGDETYHKSRTHEFVGKYGERSFLTQIVPHRHYRLVLDTIGRELQKFKRSWEMLNAVHASLIAHEAAYNIGVLHRDISMGNIMIVDNEEPNIKGGMLIDWDLCKVIDPRGEGSSGRTGTWQFMAADLVEGTNIAHTFVHDLESAFWVILWVSLAYMSNSWSTEDRSSFLTQTMSPRVYNTSGGRNKLFFMTSESMGGFRVIENPVLTDLLMCLKRILAIRHRQRPSELSSKINLLAILAEIEGKATSELALRSRNLIEQEAKEYDNLMTCLQDHTVILAMIHKALYGNYKWPEDDAATPQDLKIF